MCESLRVPDADVHLGGPDLPYCYPNEAASESGASEFRDSSSTSDDSGACSDTETPQPLTTPSFLDVLMDGRDDAAALLLSYYQLRPQIVHAVMMKLASGNRRDRCNLSRLLRCISVASPRTAMEIMDVYVARNGDMI